MLYDDIYLNLFLQRKNNVYEKNLNLVKFTSKSV